jgi:hypothetical protein
VSLYCVSRLLKCYAECHYAECRYAECRYAECHYAECHYAEHHYSECHYAEHHYAECHYAKCRGAFKLPARHQHPVTLVITAVKSLIAQTLVEYIFLTKERQKE